MKTKKSRRIFEKSNSYILIVSLDYEESKERAEIE